jgi:hypothetical protein
MSLLKNFGRSGVAAAAFAGACLSAVPAMAADHRDGEAALDEPTSDINDVYTWMNGDNLVLAMTVHPFAEAGTTFSSAVQFVWTVDAYPALASSLSDPPALTTQVHCEFDEAQTAQCWVHQDGEILDYITGAADVEEGIESPNGTKLFAGLRSDPFYFYLDGFNQARAAVIAEVEAGNVDLSNGTLCPELSVAQLDAIGDALTASGGGKQQLNDFLGANTLVIALEIPASHFVTDTAATVGVRASTHAKP